MSWLEVLAAPELWMALSLLAALLPGPQTRALPVVFRAVARALGGRKRCATTTDQEVRRDREG